MPREYIKGNNGVELTSEREHKIDELLNGLELSIDQRGETQLLAAEFWPDRAYLDRPIYINISLGDERSYTIVSSHEIPANTIGHIRWTRRDGSAATTPRGSVSHTRRGYRSDDASYHRFISRFVVEDQS